ncbi:hypothetical protein RHSIM_Rhsim13G0101400 [Rhododendron simsii]|uniref:Cyclin-like domain-containing protein n=1 Tax=Rhododendron simsii TaxID=118357 RepID=A0A834G0D5_RHOSS|nr:hypothetical protein RHSIM_Rhsim13G0101400 [Rhododendron simsii]
MGDAHCSVCGGATEVVFDHATCDTVSECRAVRLQNRCCDPDQSLISGFKTIATMCDRLGLLARIKGRACEILKKTDQFYNKGRNQNAILAACLYIACRLEDSPQSPHTAKDICSVANGVTRIEISRATKYVQEEYEKCHSVEMRTINASDAMRRFRSNLGAGEAFQKSKKFEIRGIPLPHHKETEKQWQSGSLLESDFYSSGSIRWNNHIRKGVSSMLDERLSKTSETQDLPYTPGSIRWDIHITNALILEM